MMPDREQLFDRLFHSEYGRMYKAAYILLGDGEEAKDAVQDVFAHLWDSGIALNEGSVRTFLLTCVRNRCLNIIAQRQAHRDATARLSLSGTLCEPDSWQRLSDEEQTEMIQRYVDERLSPQTGRVIRMHYDNEQPYKEISKHLGISLSAVNKHIVQGLKKLRQQFNKKEA